MCRVAKLMPALTPSPQGLQFARQRVGPLRDVAGAEADHKIAAAGEAPIPGIDRDHFVLGLRAHGHREVIPLPNSADLAGVIRGIAGRGDFVVCLGAGNITQWAYALPNELKALG